MSSNYLATLGSETHDCSPPTGAAEIAAHSLPPIQSACSSAPVGTPHSDDKGPLYRQEHMLPSPEEEYEAATTIHPIGFAPHCSRYIIAKNAAGETAMVSWSCTGAPASEQGHWVRHGTGEDFDAVDWVSTIWTELEVRTQLAGQ